MYSTRGLAPRRFRAWAALGNGDRLHSEWRARAGLPIWEPGRLVARPGDQTAAATAEAIQLATLTFSGGHLSDAMTPSRW